MRADFFGDTLVGPDHPAVGHRGAEAGVHPEDPRRHHLLVPGVLRARRRQRPGLAQDPGRCSTATSGSSTARRSGPPRPSSPTTSSCWPAPTPTPPSTQGISYLLVPMKQPGVEVRPIKQIDGSAEFNEVFFTDARCPADNVVGGVNNGWKVAMTTLGFERGTSATTGHRRFQRELDAHHRRRPGARGAAPTRGPPGPGPGLVQGQDHADQRLPLPDRRAATAPTTPPPSGPPTRCSGPSTTATS